jgi:mono/diheme cytochrome c family protein
MMLRHVALLPLTLLFAFACARETSEPSGAEIYRRFCASCHGVSGKGDGPAAASLRTAPTDLTALTRRSGGRFDTAQVIAAIDGRRTIAAHGSREMPVWGYAFTEELQEQRYTGYTVLLRASVLADYLRTIQEK